MKLHQLQKEIELGHQNIDIRGHSLHAGFDGRIPEF